MLKNKLWIGIILSIILMAFSISGFTAYYKYTQESGTNFYVGAGDKSDALEDTNEIRQIVDDLGALLVHSKRDDSYPKDLTTGGTIQIPETGLKFSNDPVNNDIAAYIAGEMTWQTKAELGIDLSLYYLKTEIDTLSEVETIYSKDIIDSDELANLKFTDLDDTPANYTDQAGKFVKVNVGETALEFGTGGGGASQLSDLSDVGVTTPTDKYVLVADGDSWESRAISSDDLSDVDFIAMLDELEYITGAWVFQNYFNIILEDDYWNPVFYLNRSRDGDPTYIVQDGDVLGEMIFEGARSETPTYGEGASIRAISEGVFASNDYPTRLEFLTVADNSGSLVPRMKIDNAGNIVLGSAAWDSEWIWTNYVNVTAAGVMTAEGTATITATDLVITNQVAGDILYFNGTNWVRLAKGTEGQILTMGATAPEWQTP